MRGADVGVYRYFGIDRPKAGAEFLPAVHERMAERGWDRLVTVLDGTEAVAIYVPEEPDIPNHLKICVLVVNESEMVIVSARGNPKPLIHLALDKAREASLDAHR
jgi:hypothetical protein